MQPLQVSTSSSSISTSSSSSTPSSASSSPASNAAASSSPSIWSRMVASGHALFQRRLSRNSFGASSSGDTNDPSSTQNLDAKEVNYETFFRRTVLADVIGHEETDHNDLCNPARFTRSCSTSPSSAAAAPLTPNVPPSQSQPFFPVDPALSQEQSAFNDMNCEFEGVQCRVRVFAGRLFCMARSHFGLQSQDFKASLSQQMEGTPSAGRSSSLFFFSRDNRIVLKTLSASEANFLVHILPGYVAHIMQNPHTLLPRFYGLYRFAKLSEEDKPLFFVCMNNVLCSNVKIWEKYDLKGSKQGRFQAKRSFTLDTVLKDLDFTRKLLVDEKMKEAIMNQLRADVKFLESFSIMDYSLLVAVHHLPHTRQSAVAADATLNPAPIAPSTPSRPTLFSLKDPTTIERVRKQQQQEATLTPQQLFSSSSSSPSTSSSSSSARNSARLSLGSGLSPYPTPNPYPSLHTPPPPTYSANANTNALSPAAPYPPSISPLSASPSLCTPSSLNAPPPPPFYVPSNTSSLSPNPQSGHIRTGSASSVRTLVAFHAQQQQPTPTPGNTAPPSPNPNPYPVSYPSLTAPVSAMRPSVVCQSTQYAGATPIAASYSYQPNTSNINTSNTASTVAYPEIKYPCLGASDVSGMNMSAQMPLAGYRANQNVPTQQQPPPYTPTLSPLSLTPAHTHSTTYSLPATRYDTCGVGQYPGVCSNMASQNQPHTFFPPSSSSCGPSPLQAGGTYPNPNYNYASLQQQQQQQPPYASSVGPSARHNRSISDVTQRSTSVCARDSQFMSMFQQDLGGVAGHKGCRHEIYYLGIIDILTPYTLKKQLETSVKGVVYKVSEISAVNPTFYAERFLSFMDTIFEV